MEPACGGVPAPKALLWAVAELVLGAQPAAYTYASGLVSASIFHRQGAQEHKRWMQLEPSWVWWSP
ncbi:hypothetical protein hbim_06535 [Mycolicibacterium mageritense]|uniref:Uncharacterized protein n=1 Tax=Mycolicibacterium mageritense TaxID=53462 RepID=A0AAI8U121_MYCME|nr:hypothetical protein hbim_06535 [Mycolicibacterium mageritense]